MEAEKRNHSTVLDALRAGRESGCSILILTHFSQRYPSCSRDMRLACADAKEMAVCFGMDLMRIPLLLEDVQTLRDAVESAQMILEEMVDVLKRNDEKIVGQRRRQSSSSSSSSDASSSDSEEERKEDNDATGGK